MSVRDGSHRNSGGNIRLVDVDDDFERCLYTVILDRTILKGLDVGFP